MVTAAVATSVAKFAFYSCFVLCWWLMMSFAFRVSIGAAGAMSCPAARMGADGFCLIIS